MAGRERTAKKRPHGAGTKPIKRGHRWYTLITLGRRPDGKLDRRWVSGATPEEAQQRARELLVAAAQGMLATHERITVSEWLSTWLEAKGKSAAPTYTLKLEAHAKHIQQHLGRVELRKLRPAHVYALARALEEKGLSPSYRREILATLEAALERAVALELIPRNAARPVRLETAPQPRKVRAWDAETVARFLEAAKGSRLYPLFYLGFATGLRREELLGLRWQDVDLSACWLRVEQVLVPVKGGVHIGPPKTLHSRRVVDFGPDVAAVLKTWKARQEEEARILRETWQNTGLVFTTSTGRPIHPRNVNREMTAIIRRHGLPPLSPHGMRHTHASLLAQRTRQIELVARRLGHARPSITLDLYRHVATWELKEVALSLGELLSPRSLH